MPCINEYFEHVHVGITEVILGQSSFTKNVQLVLDQRPATAQQHNINTRCLENS